MRIQHRMLVAAAVAGVAFAGCGKKKATDDTEEDSDPTSVSSTTPVAGTLELMPAIDVSCGGKSCFGTESAALALQSGDSFIQTMRMMAWIVMGPPATFYDTLTDEQKKLIGESGLVGRIEDIRHDVTDAAVAYYTADKALKGCASAPASGTFPVGDGLEATWVEPKLKAPAGNEWPGLYEKALTHVNADTAYRFEFNCDKKSMAVAAKMLDETVYHVFFYEIDSDDVMRTEFDLWGKGGLISEGDIILQTVMTKNAANDMQVWMSRTGPKDVADTEHLGFRYVVNKAGADDKISFYNASAGDANNGPNAHISKADWGALDHVKSDRVVPPGSSSSDESRGCAPDWDSPSDALTMDTLCTGLDLAKSPLTGLDADGNASLLWVDTNLKAKMVSIFE